MTDVTVLFCPTICNAIGIAGWCIADTAMTQCATQVIALKDKLRLRNGMENPKDPDSSNAGRNTWEMCKYI